MPRLKSRHKNKHFCLYFKVVKSGGAKKAGPGGGGAKSGGGSGADSSQVFNFFRTKFLHVNIFINSLFHFTFLILLFIHVAYLCLKTQNIT